MYLPPVSNRTWKLAVAALPITLPLSLLIALIIGSGIALPAGPRLWSGFDDHWSIESGVLDADQLILRPGPGSIGLAWRSIDSAAFTFQVRTTIQAASTAAGLIVHAADADDFSAFLISSDGYVSLVERRNGAWIDLEPWRTWPHVRRGTVSNVLRAECDGTSCVFYVNDERTAQATNLPIGNKVGVIVRQSDQTYRAPTATFDQVSAARR